MFGKKLPLVLIKYPVGTYGFAGSVPVELAFDTDRPDLIEMACRCGPGFARKAAERTGNYFNTKSWPTAEAALAQAKQYGYEVKQVLE